MLISPDTACSELTPKGINSPALLGYAPRGAEYMRDVSCLRSNREATKWRQEVKHIRMRGATVGLHPFVAAQT